MFQRLGRLFREFFGVPARGSQALDAEALRAVQKCNLEEQLAQYNRSLAATAGFCDLLREQMGKLQGQEETLQEALKALAQTGGSQEAAGDFSVRLCKLRSELADLRGQLKQAEAGCQQIAAARDAAIAAARKKMAEWKEL